MELNGLQNRSNWPNIARFLSFNRKHQKNIGPQPKNPMWKSLSTRFSKLGSKRPEEHFRGVFWKSNKVLGTLSGKYSAGLSNLFPEYPEEHIV